MYSFANRWPGHVHDTVWHMTVFDIARYVSILHEALITIEPLATANNLSIHLCMIFHEFQGRQGVVVEQGDCLLPSGSGGDGQPEQEEEEEEEEGGQGEYESFFVTNLRVFDVQRLKSKERKLKFFLTATVQTQGMDKVGRVSYEVPLITHLLNNND